MASPEAASKPLVDKLDWEESPRDCVERTESCCTESEEAMEEIFIAEFDCDLHYTFSRSGILGRNMGSSTDLSSGNVSIDDFSRISESGDSMISKRLLKYGIVPLEKKKSTKKRTSAKVKQAFDEVQRWLFVEGGHFEDVEALMTNYCEMVRNLGIPVDRLYYGGVGLHPKLTAYLWKWEPDDFVFGVMPQDVFERRNEIFSPDEPFCVLEKGLKDSVRIRANDSYIPPDTDKWFRSGQYQDYFALPDIHRKQFQGGLAWATKHEKGFSDDHIHFFELTMPALTTVMRLHTNDMVLRTLTEKMENEIEERTEELAQANLDLERANERLAVQSKQQLEHFACMSHEIRTPLNCIVGLISVIIDSPESISEPLLESLKMIHSSADLLHAVVDDVLDYSKMESGAFEVNICETNLQDTVGSVVLAMQQKEFEKEVRVRTHHGSTLPQICETDPRRLQQILYNLLGNACKFSKPGGVVDLTVSLEEKPYGGSTVKFSIKDYGKGIEKESFESIFKPFSQADKETQTVYGGTGLGLAITSKLVKRLGGKITVDSKVGEFTEFVVELPFVGQKTDVPAISDRIKDTMIFHMQPPNDNQNVYSPFTPDVVESYGLNLTQVPSWEKLGDCVKDNQGSAAQNRHHVFLVPALHFDRSSFLKVVEGIDRSQLITYGNTELRPVEATHHWTYLDSVFPTVALQTIITECAARNDEELLNDLQPKPSNKSKSEDTDKRPVDIIHVPSNGFRFQVGDRFSIPTKGDPASQKEQNQRTPPTPDPSEDITQTLKILYAEDNKINQKVLLRMLTRLGFVHVDIVENGAEAVDITSQKDYDVVFMDMQMPIMDGVEATKRIKERDGSDGPKIVFCTAHAFEDLRSKAAQVGADGFVSKPFNLKTIKSVLENAARK